MLPEMQNSYELSMLKTLEDAVDIDSHINYIKSILAKYQWPDNKKNDIEASIKAIQQKKQDKNLYLSLIGEFSSGKSTFINALLRDNLLSMDVRQATTAATTVIKHGNQLDFEITYKDGSKRSYSKDKSYLIKTFMPNEELIEMSNKEAAVKLLQLLSAREDISCNVERIDVYHPSQILKYGINIIDTPGFNSSEDYGKRHAEVASWVARDICDAAIITIPADKPVSMSLIAFIGNYLKDSLHRCIFIVTKVDFVRRNSEKEKLIKTIEQRLRDELKLKTPRVFSVAPVTVTDELSNEEIDYEYISERNRNAYKEQFIETEGRIVRILQEQRFLIQIEHLSSLMLRLFDGMVENLQELEDGYSKRHAALESNRIQDLLTFTKEQKEINTREFYSKVPVLETNMKVYLDSQKKAVITGVSKSIDNASSSSELRENMQKVFTEEMQRSYDCICKKMANSYGVISRYGDNQVKSFEQKFKVMYKSLATLGGNTHVDEAKMKEEISDIVVDKFNLQLKYVMDTFNEDTNKESKRKGYGAGAGAAIGTLILPVIGTIIGGTLGYFGSLLFGSDLNVLKVKYKDELSAAVDKAFLQIKDSCMNSIYEAFEKINININEIIDEYLKSYENLVRKMILRDIDEAEVIRKYRLSVHEELQQLEIRNRQLKLIQNRLKQI